MTAKNGKIVDHLLNKMGDAAEPAPQPAVHGANDGASRRRASTMHRISAARLSGAGVGLAADDEGAADDDSGEDFDSAHGDTLPEMIMTLLKEITGMEDAIDLNIYNLMRLAGLDRILENSLTVALQLEGEDALSEENTAMVELMTISSMEAFQVASALVNAAIKETLESAAKKFRVQTDDLILNSSAHERGDGSIKLAHRLREEEEDKRFHKIYAEL